MRVASAVRRRDRPDDDVPVTQTTLILTTGSKAAPWKGGKCHEQESGVRRRLLQISWEVVPQVR
jgi:hypothetical protein